MNQSNLLFTHLVLLIISLPAIHLYRSKHQKGMTIIWTAVLASNSLMVVLYAFKHLLS